MGSGTGGESRDWPPGSLPDMSIGVGQELCQGQEIENPTLAMPQYYAPPPPPKSIQNDLGAVLALGLRFGLTWVSVTFQ